MKLTEKEKAKELVDRFYYSLPNNGLQVGVNNINSRWEEAKKCSLIAVENEQNTLDRFADYWNLKNGEWYQDECLKIQQVKQEIEKL